jgi:hypothetical protein
MADDVTISRVEYNSLVEQITFAEDRLRILRNTAEVRRTISKRHIFRLARIAIAVRLILRTGTDPGEGLSESERGRP